MAVFFAASLLTRPACTVAGGFLLSHHAPVWVLIVFALVPVMMWGALTLWAHSLFFRK